MLRKLMIETGLSKDREAWCARPHQQRYHLNAEGEFFRSND